MPNPPESFLSSWRTRLDALKNLPPVMKIIWQCGPGIVSGSLFTRLLVALLPIAMLAIGKQIIDAISDRTQGQPLREDFWWLVGAEFGLALTGAFLGRLIGFLDSLLADRFARDLSIRIMEHASQLDLQSYEDPRFYDTLERARVQATDRISTLQSMGTLVQQIISAFVFCASIIPYSPWLLLFFLGTIPAVIGESHFAFLGYSLAFGQTPARRKLDYLRVLGASKESAKELRLFGLAQYFSKTFRDISNKIYGQNVALAKKRLWIGALLAIFATAGYYGSYVWVVLSAVRMEISIGTLTFLAGAIAGANTNIQAIFATTASLADQALFLKDLLAFFAVRPKITNSPNAIPAPRPIQEGFRFENVSFHYPGIQRAVLQNLDLSISHGERIALIGENGQGKTTIVKLLTRLYDPTQGRILLDGVDLRDYDHESLCREMGVIFQDFMRYDMTVRENIAVGRIELTNGQFDPRIEEAAHKSLADEVIERLPHRYEQILGRRFEGGVDLSGGEWQKIALSRAYLRNAQLLILDEPTAALDARSELEVFQRFAELTEGKMAVLISHRFSTVKMADKILVLSGGKIIEQGDHKQLIEQGGQYAAMFEMQAASYR